MKPLIWLLNGSGVLIMRLLGIEPSSEHGHIHSPEEIAMLIDESGQGGAISDGEYKLLSNTMRMREAMVKTIMIPRAQMLALPVDLTLDEVMNQVSESPFSRVPIYTDSIDNIIGIVHLRDLFCANVFKHEPADSLQELIRPVQFFPETVQVKVVFSSLQKTQNQVAVILDEYGGTSGMVTLEDLIEEIFGDLQDEFDQDLPPFQILSDTRLLIQGDTPLMEINAIIDLNLPEDTVETIGGLVTAQLGRIPIQDQELVINGHRFIIHQMQDRAVSSVILATEAAVVQKFRGQQ